MIDSRKNNLEESIRFDLPIVCAFSFLSFIIRAVLAYNYGYSASFSVDAETIKQNTQSFFRFLKTLAEYPEIKFLIFFCFFSDFLICIRKRLTKSEILVGVLDSL